MLMLQTYMHACTIKYNGSSYSSVEQLSQAKKARSCHDPESERKICATDNSYVAMRLGKATQ